MTRFYQTRAPILALAFLPVLAACDKQTKPTRSRESPETPTRSSGIDAGPTESVAPDRHSLPPGHPPIATSPAVAGTTPAEATSDSILKLTGIAMEVPEGWQSQKFKPGPMAAKAFYLLAGAKDDPSGCTVRVTHFPGMKGMDEQNILRWIRQVRHSDGTPATRDDATITVEEMGAVRITVVDLAGSVSARMNGMASTAEKRNTRLIAAIVDHPQGPHFVRIAGGVGSMARWESSIYAFLRSARTR